MYLKYEITWRLPFFFFLDLVVYRLLENLLQLHLQNLIRRVIIYTHTHTHTHTHIAGADGARQQEQAGCSRTFWCIDVRSFSDQLKLSVRIYSLQNLSSEILGCIHVEE